MTNSGAGWDLISSTKVLAVEGKDEINFFDALLRMMSITDVNIREVGGKKQFPKKFPTLLKTRGFYLPDGSPYVTHVAIIRDKDEDNAFQSIANIIKATGLEPPARPSSFSNGKPKVGIFIMPGATIEGTMLEDLCLETVKEQPAMKCVEEFSSCVSELKSPPKNISKAKAQVFKAQVFLAAQPVIVNSVGLGAQKEYWNFESPCLVELKAFLSHLK